MRAYPMYNHQIMDAMPYRLFVALCPPLGELARPDPEDELTRERRKVTDIRRAREAKAQRQRELGS